MKLINFLLPIGSLVFAALLAGCDKNKPYNTIAPPAQANFLNATTGSYYIKNDPNSIFKIPVGITNVAGNNRTVNISVVSPTNAASGTQYTLPVNTVTIPAGKAVDSLSVKGIFAGYPGSRVDTLTFTINSGVDVAASDYNKVYKLVLRKYCDVVGTSLQGTYTNTLDYYNGSIDGPKYTTVVSDFVSTGATSGTLIVKNLAAAEFGPFKATDPVVANGIRIKLDWSNPANFTVTMDSQDLASDVAGYGKGTIKGVGTGTFSSCDNTIKINYAVTVSLGTFSGTFYSILSL